MVQAAGTMVQQRAPWCRLRAPCCGHHAAGTMLRAPCCGHHAAGTMLRAPWCSRGHCEGRTVQTSRANTSCVVSALYLGPAGSDARQPCGSCALDHEHHRSIRGPGSRLKQGMHTGANVPVRHGHTHSYKHAHVHTVTKTPSGHGHTHART